MTLLAVLNRAVAVVVAQQIEVWFTFVSRRTLTGASYLIPWEVRFAINPCIQAIQ